MPADLLGRRNLDPLLLATWAGVAVWRVAAARRAAASPRRTRTFLAGWTLALVAWISPLCALGVALFSARVAQHMLLVLAVAPLLAWGWPARGGDAGGLRGAVTA